jgi:hypothetical protein
MTAKGAGSMSEVTNPVLSRAEKFAIAFGEFIAKGETVHSVHLLPQDYYLLRLEPGFSDNLAVETDYHVTSKANVQGYIWGALIQFDFNLDLGTYVFVAKERATTDEAEKLLQQSPTYTQFLQESGPTPDGFL